jgi:FtsZ-binding cell division protein ZapB
LNQEIVLDQFGRLEKKIENLIDACKQLEAENKGLTDRNRSLEQQLQDLIETEKQHNELRDIIRSKIDGLMGRLDEFAESQESI